MNETNKAMSESQAADPEAVRRRIHMMKLDYPFLNQQYLAKKLNRTPVSITYALNGQSRPLLARIVRHLDYLESRRRKKLESVSQSVAA